MKEYQLFQQLVQEHNLKDTIKASTLVLASKSFLSFRSAAEQDDNNIVLNKWTLEEIGDYGKIYYNEAIKIISNMPRLPSKDDFEMNDNTSSDDRVLNGLTTYLNNLIKISPLICTILAFRNFVTDGSKIL